jgi:micrococcal nuclease
LIKTFGKLFGTLITFVFIGYFIWVYVYPKLQQQDNKTKDYIIVKRVVDGDTFEIDTPEKTKVRLLGIDTPEKYESAKLEKDADRSGQDKKTIQKLGKLASEYAKNLLEGKKVKLMPEPNYEDKDKYGRLLRYVYLEDGTLFNKKIIEDGYANAYTKFEISKLGEFIQAEKFARENNRGLWGKVDGLKNLDRKKK